MNFDIFSIFEKSSVAQLQANRIKSLKGSEIRRYGVRRFENDRMYQTSRLGEATQERLLAESREWGGPGVPHEHGFAPAHTETRAGIAVNLDSLEEFKRCTTELVEAFPEFVFHGKCAITNTTTTLHSSYGLDLKTSGGLCEWYLTYQRKSSGNMFDGFVVESSADPQIRRHLDVHREYLNAQRTEAQLAGGRMPVLFVDALAPLKKLTESFSINRYRDGSCLYAGRLGEELFSSQVTLIDRAYLPEAGINQFFDGEGIVRRNDDLVLVDKGRFTSTIRDLRFGRKFGETSTGNGVRAFNTGVGLSARNLMFKKGQEPWKTLVSGLDRCLIAVVAAGGDSNDLGEFSTPVQVGYVFEKGSLVGRAPQVTVKTSIDNYLGKGLIGIASDSFMPGSHSVSVISEMDVILN